MRAIEALQKAIALRPNVAKTYIDLGLSYYFLGKEQEARAAFDKAKQLDPKINREQFPI